jgi:tetratricopeptide (TPR) repeat protein
MRNFGVVFAAFLYLLFCSAAIAQQPVSQAPKALGSAPANARQGEEPRSNAESTQPSEGRDAQAEVAQRFQQEKLHFQAGMEAYQQAQRLRSEFKSAPVADQPELRVKLNAVAQTAIDELTQADALANPSGEANNHSVALGNLGLAYGLVDRQDDAVKAFQSAIQWQPNGALYENLSTALAKAGKLELAKSACESAKALDASQAPICWLNVGIVLYNAHDFKGATEYLQRSLQADPSGPSSQQAKSILTAMHAPFSASTTQ